MDSYSRIVAFLKVVLPLAALALLSTLFLLSRSVDPTATIPFAEQDMKDRIGGQQITAPFFSGTTEDGEQIMIQAALARPGGAGQPANAEQLRARITMTGGEKITLRSDRGTIGVDNDTATFAGNVEIRSASGFVLVTDALETALSGIRAHSPGEISGTGPIGEFTAGRMEMETKTEGGPIHTLFKNGVRLVYDPKQTER